MLGEAGRHVDAPRPQHDGGLTREQEKSLWLHRAVLARMSADPHGVLDTAAGNIAAWLPRHREDGATANALRRWQHLVDDGVDAVVPVLTGTDNASIDLRQNSPFAGVLTEKERRRVLQSFREHWALEHSGP